MHPLRIKTLILSSESAPSFVRKLASRGLQPDRRIAADMASHPRPLPDIPQSHDYLFNSNAYKDYLHKLPHLTFCLVENPPYSSFCMACDNTTPFEIHACKTCGLTLCGVCQYMIVDNLVRGDLKRLIQNVARWKLGYSRAFLERERAEIAKDWEGYRKKMKEEAEERKARVDIDQMFEKLVGSFAVEGKK